ncbi:MAG TPA: hypothetical protein VGH39_04065, partial [Xanthobacteraceae bacterium]
VVDGVDLMFTPGRCKIRTVLLDDAACPAAVVPAGVAAATWVEAETQGGAAAGAGEGAGAGAGETSAWT